MSILKLSKKLPISARVTPPLVDFCTLAKLSLGYVQVRDVPRELL